MKSGVTGLSAWVLQRFSAIYLGAYFMIAIISMVSHPELNYVQWKLWFANPWLLLSTSVFIFLLPLHAWVGIRDILIDYIHPVWLRLSLYFLAVVYLLSCAFWAAQILLGASGP